ncbi:DNA-dependent RNA polymerase subunit epsilon [Virgibacillus kekensis]|uniref:DNA-directed RNA polymerase subunit epsilon n=1 Tax=Virgibacillus kekensis TaxID=202261 RepID=A0ABV9DF02_9BACI
MIYKVFYQEQRGEVPVRERTQSLYIEADSEKEVRNKLFDRNYNIEFIHPLNEAHLNYEKQSDHFKLENAQ